MTRKLQLAFITIVILLFAGITISAVGGWNVPVAQMDMPTDTPQPTSPQVTDTPVPGGESAGLPSPTWTSIFTGYTPYPDTTSTYYPMGGSGMGMSCSGMGGASMGTGMAGMGSGTMPGGMGMGATGSITGTLTTGSCPMMGGMSGMSGMSMGSGSSMSGMDMSDDYMIAGMDLYETNGDVATASSNIFTNPWLLLGWVLVGLLILGILAAIVVGILWLIRRSKPTQAT